MTDKQLLEECLEILEMWMDGENPRHRTKRMVDTLTKRFTYIGPRFDHSLTPKYEYAKTLVEAGLMIKEACASAGITPDQWYRRKRMEETGADRVGREYY